jgi:hypothetical protein
VTVNAEAAAKAGDGAVADASPQAGRVSPRLAAFATYAATGVGAFCLVLAYIRPWTFPPDAVFPEGWDLTWMQGMFQVHGQAGVFGVTDHLAYPQGLSPWAYPQLGIFAAVVAWVLVGWFSVSTAVALWVFMAAAAALNAMAVLFFFRALVGSRFAAVAATLAAVTGASSFVLARPHNANLVPFYLVPLAFAVVIRWRSGSRRQRWIGLAVLAVAAACSPLWWVTVAVLVLPFMVLPGLVRRRWAEVAAIAAALAAVLVGFALQSILYKIALPPGLVEQRDAWQANGFGGHFTDLLLSSPWLTDHVAVLQNLRAGGSGDLAKMGLIGGIGAIAAVVLLIAGPPRQWRGADTSVLASATIVSTLYFVIGGLGNFQAAGAVLIGSASPARVWSRMLLILAFVGLGWLLLAAARLLRPAGEAPPRYRLLIPAGIIVVCLGAWTLDARATPQTGWNGTSYPVAQQDLPEYAPVRFIQEHTTPCPVAQLPQNGLPFWRVMVPYDIVYRGLIPYIMLPDWYWSLGSWTAGGSTGFSTLPPAFDAATFATLRDRGFCAVMFDKQLSESARSQGIQLEGMELSGVSKPAFESDRYQVYLLDEPKP